MTGRLRHYLRDKEGTTAVEYGLIVAIIGAALISGFGLFSNNLNNVFSRLSDTINNGSTSN